MSSVKIDQESLKQKIFPDANTTAWMQSVEKILKGAPFDKKLVKRSYEGFPIKPLYTEEDRQESGEQGPLFSRNHRDWKIAVDYEDDSMERIKKNLVRDFENGANEFWIYSNEVGRTGLDFKIKKNLMEILEKLPWDRVRVSFMVAEQYHELFQDVDGLAATCGVDREKMKVSFNADPLGTLATRGYLSVPLEEHYQSMSALYAATREYKKVNNILVRGWPYFNGGASETQELGYVVATAIHYLRKMNELGLGAREVAERMVLSFATGTNFFMSVAKLRAARLMMARVLEVCGETTYLPMKLHLRTSKRVYTKRDPWVNMLRGTVGCFAGAVGGADAITVLPFDYRHGVSNDAAKRLSRNTQLILMKESQLWQIDDAARGSFYLEKLTSEMVEQAWRIVQDIEAKGGMEKVLISGEIAAQLDSVVQERQKNLATRRDPITGVSEFPFMMEESLERTPWPKKQTIPDSAAIKLLHPIPEFVAGREFEKLRDRADHYRQQHGHYPRIIMLNCGTYAQHGNRSNFVHNAFAVGGIECLPFDGDQSGAAEKLAQLLKEKASSMVVVSAVDEHYDEKRDLIASLLKQARPQMVVVAGKERESTQAWGPQHHIAMGFDIVKFLNQVWTHLESVKL